MKAALSTLSPLYKVVITLAIAAVILWGVYDPVEGRGGDSWLGYAYGIIAAVIMIFLMMLGAKRRWLINRLGNKKTWTQAHIALGSLLVVLVPLHANFQAGWNIHGASMIIFISLSLSGLFGAWAYRVLPQKIHEHRNATSNQALFDQLHECETELLQAAESLPESAHLAIYSAIERTQLPQPTLAGLLKSDDSCVLLPTKSGIQLRNNANQEALHSWLSTILENSLNNSTGEKLYQLIHWSEKRRQLLRRLSRVLQLDFLLKVWIKCHVLLSSLMMGFVIAHVVTVFLY